MRKEPTVAQNPPGSASSHGPEHLAPVRQGRIDGRDCAETLGCLDEFGADRRRLA